MIEQEADNAEVGLSLWEIGIGAGGHARRENFRIDDEVEHGQVTPVRRQKRLTAVRRRQGRDAKHGRMKHQLRNRMGNGEA